MVSVHACSYSNVASTCMYLWPIPRYMHVQQTDYKVMNAAVSATKHPTDPQPAAVTAHHQEASTGEPHEEENNYVFTTVQPCLKAVLAALFQSIHNHAINSQHLTQYPPYKQKSMQFYMLPGL